MFRLFFLRILLKLLRVPLHKIDEKRLRFWLWSSYPQQGFQDFIAKRDMTILQQMGMGASRDDYLTLLGQRIEVGITLSMAKRAYEKVEKERKEKIEATKKRTDRKILKEEPKK